jgi:hypothetical protein
MKFEYALPLTKGSVVRVVDHLDPLKPFIECTVEDIKEKFFVDGDDLVQLKFSIQKDVLAEARLGHIVTPVRADELAPIVKQQLDSEMKLSEGSVNAD